MLIIAHRGASAEAPENTIEAFDLAYAEGADGLEFDVHLAACGTPVVIHDETLPTIWLPMCRDLITPEEAEKARVAETPFIAWTANDRTEAERLLSLGVAAIMTDRPGEAGKWRDG